MVLAENALLVLLFGAPSSLFALSQAMARLRIGSDTTADVIEEIAYTSLAFSLTLVGSAIMVGWVDGLLPFHPLLIGLVAIGVLWATATATDMAPRWWHAVPFWLSIVGSPFVSAFLWHSGSKEPAANLVILATLTATAVYAHWAYTVTLTPDGDLLREVPT